MINDQKIYLHCLAKRNECQKNNYYMTLFIIFSYECVQIVPVKFGRKGERGKRQGKSYGFDDTIRFTHMYYHWIKQFLPPSLDLSPFPMVFVFLINIYIYFFFLGNPICYLFIYSAELLVLS